MASPDSGSDPDSHSNSNSNSNSDSDSESDAEPDRDTESAPEQDPGSGGTTDDPRSVLVECLVDPDRGRRHLPRIVGLFESDDRPIRLGAAWACCLVASESDDDRTVEYLVRRLGDRLGAESVSLELTQALDYLAARYPEQVQQQLQSLADEGDGTTLARVDNFTRSHYYGGGVDRDRSGRLRVAGAEPAEDPRRTYVDRSPGGEPVAGPRRDDSDPEDPLGAVNPGTGVPEPEGGGHRDDEGDNGGDENDGGVATSGRGTPETIARRTRTVSAIAERSRFDDLHVVGARHSGRYADTYEALIGQGGERTAVALRLLRLPDRTGARPQFADEIGERLADWARIHDHDGVVTVLDWGTDPRPWLATAFTGDRLSDRDPPAVERALSEARALAEAVSHAHQHGVVHGGIDPASVAYPGELLEGGQRRSPMLDSVGLLHVFRYYFDPSLCLDPRYAAPEYFDDRCGPVDHATDVYGLGATVFRLLPGRPPYDGDFPTIREGVLRGRPPRPSEVADADVPAAVDEVVSKAMATQKLTRYETIEHMEGELAGLIDG